MSRYIEERAMWDERDLKKGIEEEIIRIMANKESGKLQEDEEFDLIVDPDGSSVTMTISSLARFSSASDILKHYKDAMVESLAEYKEELELYKEEGRTPREYLIN